MTIQERIDYAIAKRNEAIVDNNTYNVMFWNGYIEGLKAVLRDGEKR